MAIKEASPQEIARAKQIGGNHNKSINWKECSFRKSAKGNIICSRRNMDIFYISKKGKYVEQNRPVPGSMNKKQNKKAKNQAEKKRKDLEESLARMANKVLKEYIKSQDSCIKIVNPQMHVSKLKNDVYDITMTVKVNIVYDGKEIGSINPITFSIQKKTEKEIQECYRRVYDYDFSEKVNLSRQTESDICIKIRDYVKTLKVLKIDEKYRNLILRNGLFTLYAKIKDPNILQQIKLNIGAVTLKPDNKIRFLCCGGVFTYNFKTCSIEGLSLTTVQDTKNFVKAHKTAIDSCITETEKIRTEITKSPGKRKKNTNQANQYATAKIKTNEMEISVLFSDNERRVLKLGGESGVRLAAASVKKWYKETEEEIQKAEEKRKQEEDLRLMSSPVYGNFLVWHILDFVKKNEQYVTAPATVKNLRGQVQTFKGNLQSSTGSGKYSLLTAEEISGMIDRLLKLKLLKEREYKGTYGRFKTLQVTEDGKRFLKLPQKIRENLKFQKYNDLDWMVYLKKITNEKKESKMSDEQITCQMELLEHKNVVILYPDLVKTFLLMKPESWKVYADTMYMIETGTEKKYWKMIKDMWKKR